MRFKHESLSCWTLLGLLGWVPWRGNGVFQLGHSQWQQAACGHLHGVAHPGAWILLWGCVCVHARTCVWILTVLWILTQGLMLTATTTCIRNNSITPKSSLRMPLLSAPSIPPASGSHSSISILMALAIPECCVNGILHIVCELLRLASFAQCSGLEIPPSCCVSFLSFFFFSCTHGMQKLLARDQRSVQSHSSDSDRCLICWTMRELPVLVFFLPNFRNSSYIKGAYKFFSFWNNPKLMKKFKVEYKEQQHSFFNLWNSCKCCLSFIVNLFIVRFLFNFRFKIWVYWAFFCC